MLRFNRKIGAHNLEKGTTFNLVDGMKITFIHSSIIIKGSRLYHSMIFL